MMRLGVLAVCLSLITSHINALRIIKDPTERTTWLERTDDSYEIMTNDTEGVVSSKTVPFAAVEERIHSLVDDDRYDRDTMMLRNYWSSLNATFYWQHEPEHQLDDSLKLNSFYLHHAQCRQCVRSNMDLIGATGRWQSEDDPFDLPDYQPARMMKWCAYDWSKRGTNETITELGHLLSDDEGYCVDANDECPGITVDLGVLDQSGCYGDDAQDKQSCEMCVLDDYVWRAHIQDYHQLDSYDGDCLPHDIYTIARFVYDPTRKSIHTLDQCPDRQQ